MTFTTDMKRLPLPMEPVTLISVLDFVAILFTDVLTFSGLALTFDTGLDVSFQTDFY